MRAPVPATVQPILLPGADLAALAIQCGLVHFSTNREFARLSGPWWESPLDAF
jgi:hypothetical protein